jgi:hypothetical protein
MLVQNLRDVQRIVSQPRLKPCCHELPYTADHTVVNGVVWGEKATLLGKRRSGTPSLHLARWDYSGKTWQSIRGFLLSPFELVVFFPICRTFYSDNVRHMLCT